MYFCGGVQQCRITTVQKLNTDEKHHFSALLYKNLFFGTVVLNFLVQQLMILGTVFDTTESIINVNVHSCYDGHNIPNVVFAS